MDRLISVLKDPVVYDMRDVAVAGVTHDSRLVEPGFVFLATKGGQTDGHVFVDGAVGRGAVAVVTENRASVGGVTNIVVEDSAKALSVLAAQYNGNPSRDLQLIGVTGTNGKTSTAHLLRSVCDVSSWGKAGIIGTVGHGVGTDLRPGVHTTPDPVTLHRLFGEMRDQGCRGVVMEVSSHAVKQQRIWGVDFEIGMLTNVTRDHLDYHPTFEDYVNAKREFCYSLISDDRRKKKGVLVYSRDNDHSRAIGEAFPGDAVSTSTVVRSDVHATDVEATIHGTRFVLNLGSAGSAEVNLKLLGSFSVSNAVLAAAGAYVLGIGIGDIKAGLEAVDRIPGRFEALGGGSRPLVIIDYSHTPDSLERTLSFCLSLGPERLITVFGCGGDRDRGKRPIMGEIAQRLSHLCFVTNDNPRSEDPRRIIDDIMSGVDRNRSGVIVEADRRAAIRKAVDAARVGDVVSVCGKGHEDYQIIGTTRHHFDDREEAEKALERWGMS